MERLWSAIAGVLLLTTLGAGSAPSASRAWPWFMLVRGGGLEQPVIVSRPAGLLSPSVFTRGEIPGDIPAIYAALQNNAAVPTNFAARRHYDVAEFWGPNWFPQVDGSAPQALKFEAGDTFARIYVGTHSTPPVWVGRSQGVDNVPRVIGDSGEAILTRAGLKLR